MEREKQTNSQPASIQQGECRLSSWSLICLEKTSWCLGFAPITVSFSPSPLRSGPKALVQSQGQWGTIQQLVFSLFGWDNSSIRTPSPNANPMQHGHFLFGQYETFTLWARNCKVSNTGENKWLANVAREGNFSCLPTKAWLPFLQCNRVTTTLQW